MSHGTVRNSFAWVNRLSSRYGGLSRGACGLGPGHGQAGIQPPQRASGRSKKVRLMDRGFLCRTGDNPAAHAGLGMGWRISCRRRLLGGARKLACRTESFPVGTVGCPVAHAGSGLGRRVFCRSSGLWDGARKFACQTESFPVGTSDNPAAHAGLGVSRRVSCRRQRAFGRAGG